MNHISENRKLRGSHYCDFLTSLQNYFCHSMTTSFQGTKNEKSKYFCKSGYTDGTLITENHETLE